MYLILLTQLAYYITSPISELRVSHSLLCINSITDLHVNCHPNPKWTYTLYTRRIQTRRIRTMLRAFPACISHSLATLTKRTSETNLACASFNGCCCIPFPFHARFIHTCRRVAHGSAQSIHRWVRLCISLWYVCVSAFRVWVSVACVCVRANKLELLPNCVCVCVCVSEWFCSYWAARNVLYFH